MYDEGNSAYLKTPFETSVLKSHLPHLVHHSDMMATRIEYEQWKNVDRKEVSTLTQKSTSKKYATKKDLSGIIADKAHNPLANFFDSKQGVDAELSIDSLFEDGKDTDKKEK